DHFLRVDVVEHAIEHHRGKGDDADAQEQADPVPTELIPHDPRTRGQDVRHPHLWVGSLATDPVAAAPGPEPFHEPPREEYQNWGRGARPARIRAHQRPAPYLGASVSGAFAQPRDPLEPPQRPLPGEPRARLVIAAALVAVEAVAGTLVDVDLAVRP